MINPACDLIGWELTGQSICTDTGPVPSSFWCILSVPLRPLFRESVRLLWLLRIRCDDVTTVMSQLWCHTSLVSSKHGDVVLFYSKLQDVFTQLRKLSKVLMGILHLSQSTTVEPSLDLILATSFKNRLELWGTMFAGKRFPHVAGAQWRPFHFFFLDELRKTDNGSWVQLNCQWFSDKQDCLSCEVKVPFEKSRILGHSRVHYS